MNLFCKHEKEYFKTRSPKTFAVSENSSVIKVSGFGHDTGANEKFVWGGYEVASYRAEEYIITPIPTEKGSGRYRLAWY
jgi:hypothetical protein